MSTWLRSLAGNSAAYAVPGVVSALVGLAVVPVYTRTFTPSDYGILSVITSVTALVAVVSVLGLDAAAHRWYVDSDEDADRQRTWISWTWTQLAVSLVLVTVLAVAATPLVAVLDLPDRAVGYLRLSLLSVPLSVGGTVAFNLFRVQRRPYAAIGISVGLSLTTTALALLLVVALDEGLGGYFLAQVLGQAAAAALALHLLRRGWLDPRRLDLERLRRMLRFALPLVPAAVGSWVVNLFDRSLVQSFAGAEEAGLYALGCSVGALVGLVTTAFQLAWSPFALSLWADSPDEAPAVFGRVLVLYAWGSTGVAALLTAVAPWAIGLIAPPSYAGAVTVVGPIAFSYVFIGLIYIAATGPTLARTTAPVAVGTLLGAALTVALGLALVPSFGREGAAVATVVSWAVIPLWVFWRGARLHPIPYPFVRAALVGLAAALAAPAARLLSPGTDLADAVVGAGIVLAVLGATAPLALRGGLPLSERTS